jgi:hypothetical protein
MEPTVFPAEVGKFERTFRGVAPYPGEARKLPAPFLAALGQLEEMLGRRLLVIVQATNATDADQPQIETNLGADVRDACVEGLKCLEPGKAVAVLLHSPGGHAPTAYQIGRCLQRHCGEYSVVVPRYAKSAATLLALGASTIYLADAAELGPLDVQLFDTDRERFASGLDEIQALERLHSQALSMIDSTMALMARRTGKRLDALLPHGISYVTHFMRPLLEKFDAVHYTATTRLLKVAEMYATRLMEGAGYPEEQTNLIATQLTYGYPEHGFVIDIGEATKLGLRVEALSPEKKGLLDGIVTQLEQTPLVGCLI